MSEADNHWKHLEENFYSQLRTRWYFQFGSDNLWKYLAHELHSLVEAHGFYLKQYHIEDPPCAASACLSSSDLELHFSMDRDRDREIVVHVGNPKDKCLRRFGIGAIRTALVGKRFNGNDLDCEGHAEFLRNNLERIRSLFDKSRLDKTAILLEDIWSKSFKKLWGREKTPLSQVPGWDTDRSIPEEPSLGPDGRVPRDSWDLWGYLRKSFPRLLEEDRFTLRTYKLADDFVSAEALFWKDFNILQRVSVHFILERSEIRVEVSNTVKGVNRPFGIDVIRAHLTGESCRSPFLGEDNNAAFLRDNIRSCFKTNR